MKEITKKDANRGRAYIIAAALLWGLAGVCVKSIPWSSLSIMATRCLVGVFMLGITQKSFKPQFTRMNLLGAVMGSLTGILYMVSIKMTTAATAIVLQYTAPIFVLLYAVIFQHYKASIKEIIVISAVFGGCILSFADQLDSGQIIGNIFGVLSGIAFAGQLIVFNNPKTNTNESMFLGNLLSFIVCTPFVFFDKNLAFTPEIIFWVLVMSVFQYGLANIFYAKGCQLVNKIETSLLLTIEPIFNPIPVAIVCGEIMGPFALVGFVIVISAVTFYSVMQKNPVSNMTCSSENLPSENSETLKNSI